jgi:hypothetical protein
MTFARSLVVFTCGLYIGKYYPQFVPLPQISQANLKKALDYLQNLEKQTK